jgi:hypothetical protein
VPPTQSYRELIDRLVHSCKGGQGQIAPKRVRAGTWNPNADAEQFPDQWAINELVRRLSEADRQILANMLEETFISGVHEALVVMHEAGVPPLNNGYEGTPFHDFIGRLNGWTWPQ